MDDRSFSLPEKWTSFFLHCNEFTIHRLHRFRTEPLHRFLHRARQLSYLAVSTPLGAATAQAAPLPAAAAEVRKGWTELEDEEILRRHTPHATHHTSHATRHAPARPRLSPSSSPSASPT